MIKLLKRPYPFECTIKKTLQVAFLVSLFVFVFLRFFQPFGIDQFNSKTYLCSIYGLITFFAIFIAAWAVPKSIPSFYNEEKWTVGREMLTILSILLLISFGNFILALLLLPDRSDSILTELFFSTFSTFVIGAFPTFAVILTNQLRLEKQNARKALELSKYNHSESSSIKSIHIQTDLKQDQINVNPNEILFAQSQGNYTDLIFKLENGSRREVIRISLSALEAQLKNNCGFFFRTHRSFLVNGQHIRKVHGNAQGYQLTIDQIEDKIPVSRNNVGIFNDFYAALN